MSERIAHKNAVRRAFSRRASSYQGRSQSWPWSWIRRREAKAVLTPLGTVQGLRVLELGCGAGFYTRLLLQHGALTITAVDFSDAMVDALPKDRVEAVVADAALLKLGRTFPRLVSAGMLEFVTDPPRIFGVAREHAEPGAIFSLLTPSQGLAGSAYKAFHRTNGVNIRLFSLDEIRLWAAQTGWDILSQRSVAPFAVVTGLSAS